MAQRKIPEINAGSMADIAFLLLVFFLVTTTIQTDKGLNVILPPEDDKDNPITEKQEKRNVLTILVNGQDQLLVEDKPASVATLRQFTKTFVLNPQNSELFAESPEKAIVSIQNNDGTSYGRYLEVYNELKAAYREMWDALSDQKFGRTYNALTKEEQKQILTIIPLRMSESEPAAEDPNQVSE